ncbi:NAD-dependent succinate-semialdehyde dehydrogenase [Rhodococcus sp. NPDC060176]|uniref:NAD-dependent succinate-semialdehyde dehydrogenase n=1 Tax=Rhodococcus sp. NPDC060176 TaxID=3347062 RepID=UPI003661070B
MTDYAVTNPATGQHHGEYPTISDEALQSALATAAATHRNWDWSAKQRAEAIARVGQLHTERREELASIIVREMGKPIDQALAEVDFCADIYAYYADIVEEIVRDEPITLRGGTGSAFIRRSSMGTLLGIMPWNYPYYQIARFAGPNLLVGNTILLKHAPQCPESAAAVQAIFDDAGLPRGAYTNVYATTDQVATLITDPRVRGVSVTGSERAGAAVAEIAGRNLKKVVLELGGSDPFILLSTDDIDAVVDHAVSARLENTGQACNAAKRFIVVEKLYDEFLEKFTTALLQQNYGDPTQPGTQLGPLSSKGAVARLSDQVDRAVAQGATLTSVGTREGCFFPAGVISGLTPANDVYYEELFGPVAVVEKVTDEDAAVDRANDTLFGLGSYVFTTDDEQALRVADRLQAGMVFVNVTGADAPELPFGGMKRSGWGRELGRTGADEFVNKKMVRIGK